MNIPPILYLRILTAFLMTFFSWQLQAADWPMLMGDPQHSGQSAGSDSVDIRRLNLAFQWDLNTLVVASPVVVNEQLLIAAENGNLYSYDLRTQKLQWIFHAEGGIASTPAVADGRIYFLSRDGKFHAVNAQDGAPLWQFRTRGEARFGVHGMYGLPLNDEPVTDPWDFYLSSALVHEGRVYFGSSDQRLYALNAVTGALQWVFKTGGVVHSSPAFAEGKIILGSWDSAVYALNAQTGAEVWRFQGKGEQKQSILLGIQASPTIDQQRVYVGSRAGHVYALNLASGQLEWTYDAQNSWVISTAAVDDKQIYFGTSDTGLLLALDKATGSERYRVNTAVWTYASPAMTKRYLVVGTMKGELLGVEKSSGKIIWRYQTAQSRADELDIIDNKSGKFNNTRLFPQLHSLHSALEHVKRLGAFIASPIWYKNQLIAVTANGEVLVFSEQ